MYSSEVPPPRGASAWLYFLGPCKLFESFHVFVSISLSIKWGPRH